MVSFSKTQEIVEIVIKALARTLGTIFVIAGVGKAFYLTEFSQTVSSITHLSSSNSFLLAISLVTFEILGGIALLALFRLKIISLLFCALIAVFLSVLSIAVFQGREIDCNCFGILNIGLSNRGELILNMILFNLFALLVVLPHQPVAISKSNRFWLAAAIVLILYVEYSVFSPLLTPTKRNTVNLLPAISYANAHDEQFARHTTKPRLLFLLTFSDFNCPPCFESFIVLCDSLKTQLVGKDQKRMIALFRQDDFADPSHPARLHRWAQTNDLDFPIFIVPDHLFSQLNISKSSVAVVSPANETLFLQQLPMMKEGHRRICELLKDGL